jgi:RNA polymerase sigma factor (TIGR02999 family)
MMLPGDLSCSVSKETKIAAVTRHPRGKSPQVAFGGGISFFRELVQAAFGTLDPLREPRLSDPPSSDEMHGELFASLYTELRNIAQRELKRGGGGGLALSATTLLHEAYFKVQDRKDANFPDQNRFLAYASRVMRNLVIDFARRRLAQKRGGAYEITSLPTEVPEQVVDVAELERLGGAIDTLEALDPKLAELVNLKFFCGLSFVELAATRGVSERTVQRDWEKARVLLQRALEGRDLLPA